MANYNHDQHDTKFFEMGVGVPDKFFKGSILVLAFPSYIIKVNIALFVTKKSYSY